MLITLNNRVADRCAHGVQGDNGEGIAVGGEGEGVVGLEREVRLEGVREELRPDRAGDGVAEGGADVVCCSGGG
jgi:hypothetical protein